MTFIECTYTFNSDPTIPTDMIVPNGSTVYDLILPTAVANHVGNCPQAGHYKLRFDDTDQVIFSEVPDDLGATTFVHTLQTATIDPSTTTMWLTARVSIGEVVLVFKDFPVSFVECEYTLDINLAGNPTFVRSDQD